MLGFFEEYSAVGLMGLGGKRTGREAGEGIESTSQVILMGKALQDLAETVRRRLLGGHFFEEGYG